MKGEEVPTKKELEQRIAIFEKIIVDLGRDLEDESFMRLSSAKTMEAFVNDSFSFGVDQCKHEMMLIPAGEFMMGALPDDEEADDDDEKPRHKVEITKDFYVGKYLVTQKLWKAVMGNNPSTLKGEERPVGNVSWYHCVKFCNKLSELEGKEPVYTFIGTNRQVSCNWNAKGYRLLTEAEWEYAARGGEYYLYAGSDNVDEVAWDYENSGGETHPVGQKKPNGFGLYDMSGNVHEWCWDRVREYSIEDQVDPIEEPDFWRDRAHRGGYDGRVSARGSLNWFSRGGGYGFRIGCTL